MLVRFRCRAHVERLRFLDQRIDDIGLTALGDPITHKVEDRAPSSVAPQHRLYRLAARRHLVEHGDVQIPVKRERQRPRYRRRRHHQNVGLRAGSAQPHPLANAEAVLFIDHHQTQALEFNTFLDQRVRPDDELCLARAYPLQRRAAFPRTQATAERLDPDRYILKQLRHGRAVLFGEKLGGRHKGRLIAVLNRPDHGEQRDDRLPAAHIALQ